MSMNPDVKKAWGEWLLANERNQGTGALHHVTDDGDSKFCCLGGLCELAVQAGVIPVPVRVPGEDCYRYGAEQEAGVLAAVVRNWAGLGSVNPFMTLPGGERRSLAVLNDNGMTFPAIWNLISAQL